MMAMVNVDDDGERGRCSPQFNCGELTMPDEERKDMFTTVNRCTS
jgi:hypothetical protein